MSGDAIDLVGSDRVDAERGNWGVKTSLLFGESVDIESGDIDMSVSWVAGCVSLGLQYEDGEDRVGVLGGFKPKKARRIADKIHEIADIVEEES